MAGHRLLLVHLFLPDTLSFQDWHQEGQNTHYRVPSQQVGAIPSTSEDVPPPPSPHPREASLPVDELKQRLARASISQDDDDAALSDSESPPIPISAPTRTRSARSSFNEQTRKISMSMLMSEAAQGGSMNGSSASASTAKHSTSPPGTSHVFIHSRRGSASASAGPNITMESSDGAIPKPLPVGAASDHGRSAASGVSPSHSPLPLPSSNQSLTIPKISRGGSSNGFSNTLQSSSSLIMTPAHLQEGHTDGSGTRAPGAKVSGKAGTMTPLSIIGDLAVS